MNPAAQPLPPTVRRLWRLMAVAVAAATAVGLGAVEMVARRSVSGGAEETVPMGAIPVVAALIVAGGGWTWATLRYRAWSFEITEAWFQARWGVFGRYCATVPRNRVQTLTSHNGPLDRLLGLTTVTVHTAGAGAPNVTVPHLDDATVDWLRLELARGPVG